MSWKSATILVALSGHAEPGERDGYSYRGLGLWMINRGSPRKFLPAHWSLTHLGSGHKVCDLMGKKEDVLPIASEIAECTDWNFDGLDGWRNRSPDLLDKCNAIFARHGLHGATRKKQYDDEARTLAAKITTARAL